MTGFRFLGFPEVVSSRLRCILGDCLHFWAFGLKRRFSAIYHFRGWVCFRIMLQQLSGFHLQLLGMDRELDSFSRHQPLIQLNVSTLWRTLGDDTKWTNYNHRGSFFGYVSSDLFWEWHTQAGRDIDVLSGGAPLATFTWKVFRKFEAKSQLQLTPQRNLWDQSNTGCVQVVIA